MLHKLSVHAAKGPWDKVELADKIAKLEEEYRELRIAIDNGAPFHEIMDECADLANMCLIISDHYAMAPQKNLSSSFGGVNWDGAITST